MAPSSVAVSSSSKRTSDGPLRVRTSATVGPSSSDTSGSAWPGAASITPSVSTHRPSRVMPTGTTSYRSRSITSSTDRADRHDTWCSLDRPP